MISRYAILAECGFEIVSISGSYCRACREGHDVILRWTGDRWMAL